MKLLSGEIPSPHSFTVIVRHYPRYWDGGRLSEGISCEESLGSHYAAEAIFFDLDQRSCDLLGREPDIGLLGLTANQFRA